MKSAVIGFAVLFSAAASYAQTETQSNYYPEAQRCLSKSTPPSVLQRGVHKTANGDSDAVLRSQGGDIVVYPKPVTDGSWMFFTDSGDYQTTFSYPDYQQYLKDKSQVQPLGAKTEAIYKKFKCDIPKIKGQLADFTKQLDSQEASDKDVKMTAYEDSLFKKIPACHKAYKTYETLKSAVETSPFEPQNIGKPIDSFRVKFGDTVTKISTIVNQDTDSSNNPVGLPYEDLRISWGSDCQNESDCTDKEVTLVPFADGKRVVDQLLSTRIDRLWTSLQRDLDVAKSDKKSESVMKVSAIRETFAACTGLSLGDIAKSSRNYLSKINAAMP